jgi:uncharacterized protein YbjT (DUF2867 family)
LLEQNKVLQIAYKDQTIINFNGKHLTILVTGCSGFIGSHLVYRLLKEAKNGAYEVRCMTRSLKSIDGLFGNESNKDLKFVSADASKYSDLVKVMTGVNIAFYLIHSMEGSSKNWKKFAERDRVAASNFARAATKCGVERIIYLGGLVHENEGEQQDKLSEHMQSRLEVGKILTESTAKVTIFRAAIIIGQGGGSYQMLRYLVERLPVMVCPKWVLTRSQPIALDDVITYLIKSIESKETEGRSFDLGGPDILSYIDMMRRYGRMLDKSVKIMIIPFLTPKLSSYWIDLITPVKASLARPLVESLKHEAIVKDDSLRKIIPFKLKSFEEAIELAKKKEQNQKNSLSQRKERVTHSDSNKILFLSLVLLAAIGSTYYMIGIRPELLNISWLVLDGLWYFGIAFSIFFIRNGARLGAITAGAIGWITLAFWTLDSIYTVSENPIISNSFSMEVIIRNFIGIFIAILVVASSHNVFHKIRIYGL